VLLAGVLEESLEDVRDGEPAGGVCRLLAVVACGEFLDELTLGLLAPRPGIECLDELHLGTLPALPEGDVPPAVERAVPDLVHDRLLEGTTGGPARVCLPPSPGDAGEGG
jgi:hypothetical protein